MQSKLDPKKGGGEKPPKFKPEPGHPGHNSYRIKQADLNDKEYREAFDAVEQNILDTMGPDALKAGELADWATNAGPISQVVAYLMNIGDKLDQPHEDVMDRWATMRDGVINHNIDDPRFKLDTEEGRRNLLFYSVYSAMKKHVESNGKRGVDNDPKAYSMYRYLQERLEKPEGK